MGSYEGTSGYSLGGNSPTLYGGYLDVGEENGKYLKSMMDWRYTSSYPANAAYWQQGSIDYRFKVGDQSLWSMIYGDNQWYQSRRFFFNLINRHIQMICGYQRKNRKSTVAMPNQIDTDPLVDDYNKAIKWVDDRNGFQEYFSQGFEGAVTAGSSLLHIYPDYTLDPVSGDLFCDQVSYNNFLIDPYYRKQDLTDCGFVWRRRWVNKTQAKALLPGRSKEIDKMNPSGMKDGRFPLQAELINLDTNRLFTYDEFHYRDSRPGKIILDPKTGEAAEWEEDGDDSDDLLKQVMQQQPWLKVKEVQIPTVKLCLSLGGIPMYHGPNLLNIDQYPFVPMLCYHEPDIQSYAWRQRGVVRNLRDSQYLYNMRKVIELDILQSQINSGWIYKTNRVTDPKAFRQSGQGFVIPLKDNEYPIQDSIQRIDPPSIPPSMIELSRSLAEDITKISGVNEELLGAATDDKAGILAALRQGAGLVTLQTIFDKADYSQRIYGKIMFQAIRKNFSKGKIKNILGHDPDPRFFTSHSMKYAITVEEANYSTSQRQMELQQLLHFKEIGIPISNKDIISAAFITNKQRVIENMEQEQQQQAQQGQQQAQMQAQESQSKVMLNVAKAREASSKVDENEALAEHKTLEADLNLVKLMIELESLDSDVVRSSFEMAMAIKEANSTKPKEIDKQQGGQNG